MFHFHRFHPTLIYLCLSFVVTAGCHNQKPDASSGGVKASEALATMQVPEGFKIEMIAAEPLISSPVDMEIDEYGRMYVVEMHGYPLDKSGTGNIVLLTDTNGDGIMDKRTVFKDNLMLPTGILRWKKGILVTDSPNIIYLEDTDNDGKADKVDTLLTGFGLTNPQHNLNSPVYGLDNWIYAAHEGVVKTRDYMEEFGDEGTEIYYPADSNAVRLPQNAGGRSVRFRPDHTQLEMLSSRCQFGQTFDQWGHLFGCNNSNQGYQEVIANRYFERNPHLLVSDATQSMSDHLDAAEVFPTTTNPDRQLLTNVGIMTSACGLTDYMGDAFPAPYNQHITFIAEPVSNLVHVDVLKDSGASFVASRILPNKEFLTSTDAWSRPVNMYVGPDGALYVLDYYRRVIESPEWLSDEVIAAGGLYDGVEQGRIYRITATNGAAAAWMKGLQLGDAKSTELVQYLSNKNSWWRTTAQRLLVDRADKSAVPALIAMTQQPASDVGRLHALWTLEGMGALGGEQIIAALKDSVAGIRENAVKLAELHLSTTPELVKPLLSLQTDPNHKVRLQLLLTLGFLNTPEAAQARNKLLFTDINDKWAQIAALSANSSQSASLLKEILNRYQNDVPAYASLVQRLTAMMGGSDSASVIHQLIEKSTATQSPKTERWQAAILKGLAQGMKNRKSSLSVSEADQQQLIKTFFTSPSNDLRRASFQLLKTTGISDTTVKAAVIAQAVAIASDPKQADEKRADAIDFISLGDATTHLPLLEKLIVPQEQLRVQLAALRTLNTIPSNEGAQYLIKQWPVMTTDVRDAAINVFLDNQDRMALLIDAMEKNKIQTTSVSFNTSVGLMQVRDEKLRERARKLFTRNQEQAKTINKEYQASLDLKGDPVKGKDVYMQSCAICHQMKGELGVAFGPDLSTIHNWKKEDMLANILDPNLSILGGYDLWQIEMNNGESIQGIIATETATAITVKSNGKMDRLINRQDVKSLKSLSMSPMPQGLEKNIDKQAMADLLAFLRQH
ncbi:PVC-type heme-binding CxxCH protein [Chitinophaga defluvii]|uniref:PVC-type heme-binding CxxCH protein n=1 Tax=Chitinophaga defluvii TaxID=3163343 RepID=A0ABV2TD62_9BACT